MWVLIFPISTASKYSLEKHIWKKTSQRLCGNCIFLLGGKLLLQKKECQQTLRGSARCMQCAAEFRGTTDTGQLLASKTIHILQIKDFPIELFSAATSPCTRGEEGSAQQLA